MEHYYDQFGDLDSTHSSSLENILESSSSSESMENIFTSTNSTLIMKTEHVNGSPSSIDTETPQHSTTFQVPSSNVTFNFEMPKHKVDTITQTAYGSNNAHNFNTALVPMELTPVGPGHSYVDVTPYLDLSQNEAAKKLNIPSSTLSKRWREATVGRKWPYRNIAKVEKEIQTLLKNAPNQDSTKLPAHMQDTLARLMKRKVEECRQVYIRLY